MAISFYKIKKWTKMILGKSQFHVSQNIGKCYSVDRIEGYYNDLTEKVTRFGFPNGQIPKYPDENGKIIEFSIGIFQYGLACFDLYLLNKDCEMLENAIICSNWALDNQNLDGSWDTFITEDPNNPYSSMAQGEAISLLSRIYTITKDELYLNAIIKAKDFMLKPLQYGGCTYYCGNDIFLYEITNWTPVLNGWIFSIWGLLDYCKLYPEDIETKDILQRTINTLENSINLYDTGFWSRYDFKRMIASPFYHNLHINQLHVMYNLTGIQTFDYYANKWERYQGKWINKSFALIIKIYQKLID